jgi:exonuclease III
MLTGMDLQPTNTIPARTSPGQTRSASVVGEPRANGDKCTSRPKNSLRIATWNVRTMNRPGKLENIIAEMNRYKIDVMGLCETRWQGQDDYECDGIRVISAGGQASQRGVAVLLNSNVKKCVHSIEKLTDRLMKITIQAEPVNLVIIQVYMPTSDHDDNEID